MKDTEVDVDGVEEWGSLIRVEGLAVRTLTIRRGPRQLVSVPSEAECLWERYGGGMEMQETETVGGHEFGAGQGHIANHHDGGLLVIGIFKLVEAVFFLLVGMGAIHFVHRDLGDAALRLATKLRLDPEGRMVGFMLDHLDYITAHRLKQIGILTFLFAAIRVAEGVGLVMEKAWAEYLTVGVTLSFLPWEMYEIARRRDWFRVCLFVINLLVLAYLVTWIRRKRAGDGLRTAR